MFTPFSDKLSVISYDKMKYIFLLLLLVSCSPVEINKEYFGSNYSTEDLEFFKQVGFYNQKKVFKWNKDIQVSLVGSPHPGDQELIDTIIHELKPLLGPISISRTEGEGNLRIKFVKQIEKKAYAYQKVVSRSGYNFALSDIYLPDKLRSTLRQATLRHEMLHALGLHHPTERGTGTIIESSNEYASVEDRLNMSAKKFRFSELDKRMVRLLYDENMKAGLERSTFVEHL